MVAPVPFALDHVLDAVVEACVRELTASERWLAIARAEAMGLEGQLAEREAELATARREGQAAADTVLALRRRVTELEREATKQADQRDRVVSNGSGRSPSIEGGKPAPTPARAPRQRRKPASLTPPALAGTPEALRHPLKPPRARVAPAPLPEAPPPGSFTEEPSEPTSSKPHIPDDDEDQEDDLLARSLELAADDKHGKGWHTAGARLSGGEREERRRKEREDEEADDP